MHTKVITTHELQRTHSEIASLFKPEISENPEFGKSWNFENGEIPGFRKFFSGIFEI
jgi:hypothetical protein